jgi:hypothetical protein
MTLRKEEPAGGAAGASKCAHAARVNASEDTALDHYLQQARHDVTTFEEWFDAEPVFYKGQGYYALGTEPYTRRDGQPTTLQIWRSRCARCGEAFTFKRSAKAIRFQPNRRCTTHRWPGRRVRKLFDGGAHV